MKITGLILGTSGTLTKDMLKKNHLEKDKNNFSAVPELHFETMKKVKKIFLKSLPSGVEHTFAQIKEEHQILDLPESDVYVVFPFQFFHDR